MSLFVCLFLSFALITRQMPHCSHVSPFFFPPKTQVQEDVPEVRPAAGTSSLYSYSPSLSTTAFSNIWLLNVDCATKCFVIENSLWIKAAFIIIIFSLLSSPPAFIPGGTDLIWKQSNTPSHAVTPPSPAVFGPSLSVSSSSVPDRWQPNGLNLLQNTN